MNKRSKLIVCGIAVIAVLCMALPVLFHGTSNECKITGVSAADSRNHSVDTYTVEQDKKKCSVSFTDTAVIDTAFTAEVSTDEPYIIELTVRDSQLPEYREIKDENVAMNTAQTAVKGSCIRRTGSFIFRSQRSIKKMSAVLSDILP